MYKVALWVRAKSYPIALILLSSLPDTLRDTVSPSVSPSASLGVSGSASAVFVFCSRGTAHQKF